MLEVRNLQKSYGTQQAVSDVSFQIGGDEIVGFLGVNGAGKSTTMRMITGVIDPDGGNILVCGIDRVNSPIEAKRHIGYLAENNPLYLDMYVREFLRFVVNLFGIDDDVEGRVEAMIDRVGLRLEAHKRIKELSKGYKQRVGLAQALIHSPEVLVLDEPTTGLDPNQLLEVRALIKEETKGRAVLLSSHVLQEIEALCSRVIIIDKGMVVADLTIEELKRLTEHRSVLDVEFDLPMKSDTLRTISGVVYCELFAEGRRFRLSVTNDIREVLFAMCKESGNTIHSLSLKPSSLEDLFSQFTKRES